MPQGHSVLPPHVGRSLWVTEASYIVYEEGGEYRVRDGATGGVTLRGPDRVTVLDQLMAVVTHGTVFLKEVIWDTGIPIPADTLVVQSINGVESWYDDTGLVNVNQPGSNTSVASYTLWIDGGNYYCKDGQTGRYGLRLRR